jgi:asparagine synthase (glutamine-hydrolysing)
MCGITGRISRTKTAVSIEAAVAELTHRGPEEQGHWSSRACGAAIELGHARLRIIDLSPGGHQPMTRGNSTVVFNGEIYNFQELRRDLEEDGCVFSSSSDTEVIPLAYARWGIDSISRLHGMFAFAIWNGDNRELILVRDRLGKKPLFYFFDGNSFVFGSEIKAVLALLPQTPEIDPEALNDYLTYLYIPYPKTIFRGIMQLPPATWMRVSVRPDGLKSEMHQYWSSLEAVAPASHSASDLASNLQDLLGDAVQSRLVADVPLGVLLSGGMDSSTITAIMARTSTKPVHSFSIGFPAFATYNELPFARTVAQEFGCSHEILEAEASCSRHLAKIVWHFDQPFGNPTAVLTYILSELTKRSVTVALTGDGGDELFGGYPRYIGAYLSSATRSLPSFFRKRILPWLGGTISDDANGHHQLRRLREFLEESGLPLIEMYLRWIEYFSREAKTELLTDDFRVRLDGRDSRDFLRGLYSESEGLEPLNRLAYVDTKSFLCCNVLEYADRMSMAHALELRSPLTDHRLVEFALHVPFHWKFRYGETKWLLKRAMEPFLPSTVLQRHKLGFNPPTGAWLSGELRALPAALLGEKALARRGLFQPAKVRRLLDFHLSGRRDYSLHIWALMILEIWFRIYMDGRSVDSVQEDIDAAVKSQANGNPLHVHTYA